MNKKVLLCLIVSGIFLFAGANRAVAISASLPAENDLLWTVANQIHDPIDYDTCYDEALAVYVADGDYGDGTAAATGACAGLLAMRNKAATLESSGIETNLFDNTVVEDEGDLYDNDWRAFDNLYFEVPAYGKIEFTEPINFMSYDFLTFLSEFATRAQMSQGEIGLDADIVGGLAGYGAVLTMYDAGAFDEPEILVDGSEDSGGVVSGLSYDPVTHDITFDAAHFTTFEAVEKDTTKKPRITNVDIEKYTSDSGQEMIKVKMKGRNFKKSTEFKLGGKLAAKVSYKSSKKIVATFKLSKLIDLEKENLKLKGFNGNKMGQYRKKIPLADLL